MESADWVIIGRFGRPHGIKGNVIVHSFTNPASNLFDYVDWHILVKEEWKPINPLRLEICGKLILALVEGYPERDDVARLTNLNIAIKREQLPTLGNGEFYWHELTGMQVINNQGIHFGKVIDMLSTGSNDVLVVEGEKRRLIPYLPGRYVVEVNADEGIIHVDWDADF